MDKVRNALGWDKPTYQPPYELTAAEERARRIRERQKAIDIQVDVLRADRRDARQHPR